MIRKTLSLLMVAAIFASPVCSQHGFISLDCGGNENYTDDAGIQWMPDDAYINSGEKWRLPDTIPGGRQSKPWNSLRSFPETRKSCYQLTPVEIGRKYLLRGSFRYGNYDNRNFYPEFILLLDADIWDSISLSDPSLYVVQKEIIFMAKFDPTQVCLARINENSGLPVISSLELRPLNQSMYWPVNQDYSLLRLEFSNFGAQVLDKNIRYPDDPFDRLWSASPIDFPNITTKMKVSIGMVYDQPPSLVMQTAETSYPSTPSVMNLPPRYSSRNGNLYISMYFVELQADLNGTNLREFDLFLDNNKLNDGPIQPIYLQSSNVSVLIPYEITNNMQFRLQETNRSTLPPITNALEIYRQSAQRQQGTFTSDVEALTVIQEQINYTYVGDPCLPLQYSWDWLVCNNDILPRIVILNLSKKGLTGNIPVNISSLTTLKIIDLSDNDLNGTIPESLAGLTNLKKLDLANNNLTGPVPAALINKKSLNLSLSGNVHLCYRGQNSCKSKSTDKGLTIGLSIGGCVIGLSILLCITVLIIRRNRRRREATEPVTPPVPTDVIPQTSRAYSYNEVKEITGEFSRQIGRGGFGPVYHGRLNNGQEVAVKVCSETSNQGTQEFTTEVILLLRVHHRNLVSLLGYCCEGAHQILIYELMPKGNLDQLLHGSSPSRQCLDWKTRLDITLNAAQGLEYLHSGCIPPIIHRDIKSANILLSEGMEARLADFGLSKEGPCTGATHITTDVKGTFGYLDPEYYGTGTLRDKSDVYSFGIVILEIISGRKPVYRNNSGELINILSWARSMISQGHIDSLIDNEAGETYHPVAMSKVAELVMLCTEKERNDRPSMSHVVTELKEAVRLLHSTDSPDRGMVNNAPIAEHFSSSATVESSVLSPR